MKKILTIILLFGAMAVSACWFTSANFNAVYISGVNNYISHYEEVQNIESATSY